MKWIDVFDWYDPMPPGDYPEGDWVDITEYMKERLRSSSLGPPTVTLRVSNSNRSKDFAA